VSSYGISELKYLSFMAIRTPPPVFLCYGSTAIQTSNNFSLLDELMNTSGEQNIPNPVHSSTPKQKEKRKRKEPFMDP
jgi:hypothetical protein